MTLVPNVCRNALSHALMDITRHFTRPTGELDALRSMLRSSTVTYVVTRLVPQAAAVLLEEKYKVLPLWAS